MLIHNGVLLAGMGLLIVGLGFKVAAVPFHFWSPDVYQGAPTPFVGYMAAVAKAAGFAGLVRVLMLAFPTEVSNWRPIIWVLATASVLVGAVLALVQSDLKRMLAYSSVSQAGYVLIGLQDGTATGVQAVCFYVFTYAFMVIGTFAIVGSCRAEAKPATTSARSGGCRRAAPGWPRRCSYCCWARPASRLRVASWPNGSSSRPWFPKASTRWGSSVCSAPPSPPSPTCGWRSSCTSPQNGTPAIGGQSVRPLTTRLALQTSDLQTVMAAGLVGRDSALALRAAPTTRLRQPPATTVAIAICAVFTIFAGVSTPLLSMAHSISLPW